MYYNYDLHLLSFLDMGIYGISLHAQITMRRYLCIRGQSSPCYWRWPAFL